METGILEVGEYVIYDDFLGSSVLCEVMDIVEKEDDCRALLRPTRKFNFFGSTNEMVWCSYKAISYREFDSKKFLPPMPGTTVYHKDYCDGSKPIQVKKICKKSGVFSAVTITNVSKEFIEGVFTFEGVLLEQQKETILTDEEISKLNQKIDREVGFEIEKKAINEAAKIASNCCFDNESIVRQKERAIAFQVRFLTDERLCELRKRLGEAYENARVVGFIRKDGGYELKCDNVSQRTIDKIVEKIAVYTKQNFPELIIEE